jgi:hypothetical protein
MKLLKQNERSKHSAHSLPNQSQAYICFNFSKENQGNLFENTEMVMFSSIMLLNVTILTQLE